MLSQFQYVVTKQNSPVSRIVGYLSRKDELHNMMGYSRNEWYNELYSDINLVYFKTIFAMIFLVLGFPVYNISHKKIETFGAGAWLGKGYEIRKYPEFHIVIHWFDLWSPGLE